jgi:cardiolipin synthase
MACWPWLLVFLGGCHSAPARPAAGPADSDNSKRGVVLARQILHDTALQASTHPIETGCLVAASTAAWATQAGREFFAKRCLVPLGGMPAALDEERPTLDPSHLEDALAHLTHRPLEPALIHMDVDGEEALRRLEGLIGGAARSIDVLMYQWDSDALGWAIAQRLAERARALSGGKNCPAVRVLIDGGGNLIHGPPCCTTAHEVNEVLGWLGVQPNVEVLRTRNALARFDHRKLMIVDGRIAWTGGRNFTLSSFFEYHDVSFALEGSLVRDLSASFEEAWQNSGGHPRLPGTGPVLEVAGVNGWARVVGTGRKRNDLASVLYRAVDRSAHHVYLENPYFTDTLLWCKLAKARRRGADVRVVFAHDSQSRVIDKAMRVTANRLLRAGVRVYMHPGTTHVKAASVDTRWAYLGTGNFDKLSLRRNNEVGIAIGAGPLIEEVEQTLFMPDFRPEWEVTEPLTVTLGDYLCEAFATLIL